MKFLTAQTTPAALPAGNTNDYAPANLEVITHLRQATNAAGSTLTGLIAQTDLDLRVIANLGPGNLTLTNEDASSVAANRFTLPGGLPYVLAPGGSIMVAYDMPTSRWTVWAGQAQPSTPAAQDNVLVYGDGSDGDVTISVDTTLSRNMFYNNLTINTGVTVTIAGFLICVKNTLTLTGTAKISADGLPGVTGGASTNAGGAAPAAAYLGGGNAGGAGASGGGGTAGGSGRAPRSFVVTAIGSVAAGQPGTNGGIGQGGGGGGGEGVGGTCTGGVLVAQTAGDIHDILNTATGGYARASGNSYTGGSGGGGAGGDNVTPRSGGGGGSGGGVVVVRAANVVGTGSISANGGKGGDASAGATARCGGGGGGGGGIAILIYRFGIAPNTTGGVAVTTTGGVGGAKLNAGGKGGDGGNGIVIVAIA